MYSYFQHRTTKDLFGGANISDDIFERSENTCPSLASLAYLSDVSTMELSHTPTPSVLDPPPSYTPRPHSRSTGDLVSTIQNTSQPFRRQLSAVETQTNYMKDLLNDRQPALKKSENVREEKDASFFAPGSTPQYKVIYKDMCEVASSNGSADRGRSCEKRRYQSMASAFISDTLICLETS